MNDQSLINIIRSFLDEIEDVKDEVERYFSLHFHAMAACMTDQLFECAVREYQGIKVRPIQ